MHQNDSLAILVPSLPNKADAPDVGTALAATATPGTIADVFTILAVVVAMAVRAVDAYIATAVRPAEQSQHTPAGTAVSDGRRRRWLSA